MKPALRRLAACAFSVACLSPLAAQNLPTRQDPALIKQTVEEFLTQRSAGLPGELNIEIGVLDGRLNLPACALPEAFLAHGNRAWGKTSVGVRCGAPTPWTIYVAANVHVLADYYVTALPLAPGQRIVDTDIVKMRGDLTTLPPGIVTAPEQALGRSVSMSLPAGMPLRQDGLRSPLAIQQGQAIRVVSAGTGFKVSVEGRALNNANEGQITQARTANGNLISGTARAGGVLEVGY